MTTYFQAKLPSKLKIAPAIIRGNTVCIIVTKLTIASRENLVNHFGNMLGDFPQIVDVLPAVSGPIFVILK